MRILSLLVVASVFACSGETAPAPKTKAVVDDLGVKPVAASQPVVVEPKPVAAKDPATEASSIFAARCAVCHGASGKGDGVTAAAMTPKPRNYADKDWQKSVTDDEITNMIVQGGQALGKSPLMPANADLAAKPAVVAELVKMIRAFAEE